MNSPIVKTIVFVGLAAVVSVVAAAIYPWPEAVVESDLVGKPLFESYDVSTIRTIEISKFNDDKQAVDRMVLERIGERWIIPSMKKFVSTAPTQIALTSKALNELTVLEQVSKEQQDHITYGVVDPAEFRPSGDGTSVGSKLTLEDRKGREIASLIVGKGRKNETQPGQKNHFVRIAGQPTVYLIEFDSQILKTEFASWVDPNLFKLSTSLPGVITVDNYRIDKQKPAMVNRNYLSKLVFEGGRIRMASFEAPGKSGQLAVMETTAELKARVEAIGGQIGNIRFPDVQKKPSKLSKVLKNPLSSADEALFAPLAQAGFFKRGFRNETFEFESLGGKVSISTADAVVTNLYVGDVATNAISDGGGRLSRYVMICAGVDEAMVPMPQKPEDPKDKEYLRKLQQRDEILKSAKVRASEINQRHASWYYLVPENIIEGIRPSVDASLMKAKTAETSENPKPEEQDAGTDSPVDEKKGNEAAPAETKQAETKEPATEKASESKPAKDKK